MKMLIEAENHCLTEGYKNTGVRSVPCSKTRTNIGLNYLTWKWFVSWRFIFNDKVNLK